MKMKLGALSLGFMVLVFAGCATMTRTDTIDIYQKTKSYKNFSFDEVWASALRSVDETGFMVRSAAKEVGLIHAVIKKNPDPGYLPPVMNVVIRKENNRIDVNFHIELPGQKDESGTRRSYANQFFKVLKKNLK
jgi:hypothetical protein